MGVSSEGAGWFYRAIVFPLGLLCVVISLLGGFGDDSPVMLIASICVTLLGFLGPKIFGSYSE